MARGRPPLSASRTPTNQRSGYEDPPETATRSGRVTRSSSSQNLSNPGSVVSSVGKSGQGRSSKTSSLARDSMASTSASAADITSPSDYSTPATTSIEATPAPNIPGDGSSKQDDHVPTGSSLEIHIPAVMEKASSERTTRNSRYSMNPKTKKARQNYQVPDSEEDEDELSSFQGDELVARRLQEEEYRKPLPQSFKTTSGKSAGVEQGRPAKRSLVSAGKRPAKRLRADPAVGEEQPEVALSDSEADDYLLMDDSGDKSPSDGFEQSSDEDVKPMKKSTYRRKPARRASARHKTISATGPELEQLDDEDEDYESPLSALSDLTDETDSDAIVDGATRRRQARRRASPQGLVSVAHNGSRRSRQERHRLETNHPELRTMWTELAAMPLLKVGKATQPLNISRQLKGFQLEGLAWMKEMEKGEWKGGLLGDEMGLGKTIQAVSLIMSDWPAKKPTLVLVPPVALMQWSSEIASYTDGTLKTFVFHGTNAQTKGMTVKDLKRYDVIMMSYNSLESMYRKQEKGFKRKDGLHKEKSLIHQISFHRVLLDEAHCIKTRTTMTAKACFALKVDFRWCLTGTPLQNRIGEFFSLIRFLNIRPFASYLCKQCPCSSLEWSLDDDSRCTHCKHAGMQHVSVFNQELLNPIQKFGNLGPGAEAFKKLRLMTDRIMLRRLKKDHTNSMDLPVKEIHVDRQFFGEVENDFANSIMTNSQRKFETYVAQGVLLNNYANIFGLIMQMRQVADHPDLLLKKSAEGGQNILVCCICDEPAEDAIRSRCKHDFCRACATGYLLSSDEPDCPQCHIPLSIDLEQPEMEQDESLVKKSSIINRIKMENWTSSSKIELLVRDLHRLRSDNASHKSIIFSQFTSMLQLIEWRLRRVGVTTVMLDGSMSPAQRQASIEHFMKNPEVECFLVSLKAGGVALNLTEASSVFIVDPWWNPAAEWQSADRCHRIGQTRPCSITRLCIEDSVESRMVLIQEKKTNMIHSTVNADDKAMESLSPQDMQFLFRGS